MHKLRLWISDLKFQVKAKNNSVGFLNALPLTNSIPS